MLVAGKGLGGSGSKRKAKRRRRTGRGSQRPSGDHSQRLPPPSRLAIFGLVVGLSALLIFLVQPMVGKRLLPWYGGAPGVWALCLAFYQVTLFAGYAYAHALMRLGRPRIELGLHGLLFVAAVLVLPVLPGEDFRPLANADATHGILSALVANVALPFLFLAATGPLVQAWFARAYPLRSPYFLYSLSNGGSLLALFAYPFLVEPNVGLADTGSGWSLGFVVIGLAVLGCGGMTLIRGAENDGRAVGESGSESIRIPAREVSLWMVLSGLAVVLLMGVTNQLCLDIASVPFLWILPLAVYLVTFILCFASEGFYRRWPLMSLVAISSLLLFFADPVLSHEATFTGFQSRLVGIGLYLALLFGACMLLHGELFRRRPPASALTSYYLWISAGGALGGIFVGILAERWFIDYYEVPAALAAWWVLALGLALRDSGSGLRRGAPMWRKGAAFAVAAAALLAMLWGERFRVSDVLHQQRSFFGVLRVLSSEPGEAPAHVLRHGTTLHGLQFTESALRLFPTAYYGFAGGVGLTLQGTASPAPMRVGVIGLGVGTLAAYGRHGDFYRFYEIDPEVVALAQRTEFFSFLSDSKAEIDIVEADGRLALENEERGGEPGWDVLVLDAFSSDAVPVHLLTREAFALYERRLAPGGVLAIHVSNRHLALTRLAFGLARSTGLAAAELRTGSVPRLTTVPSRWVVVAREPEELSRLLVSVVSASQALRLPGDHLGIAMPRQQIPDSTPVWTDDYSDLFSLLRMPSPPPG